MAELIILMLPIVGVIVWGVVYDRRQRRLGTRPDGRSIGSAAKQTRDDAKAKLFTNYRRW
jgi:hypothetical protein